MQPTITVTGFISKPDHEVYEAVADPAILSRYFTTGGAKGRMEPGATVTWDFADFPGEFPVHVVEANQDERIVFTWGAAEGSVPEGETESTVTFTFEARGEERTLVTISGTGFADTDAGWAAVVDQTGGWTAMLCAMKVWLEHGINIREGFYI